MPVIVREIVIREAAPFKIDPLGPKTIGEQIDADIAASLEAGQELRTVSVEFSESDWASMFNDFHNTFINPDNTPRKPLRK